MGKLTFWSFFIDQWTPLPPPLLADLKGKTVPANQRTEFFLPLNVTYVAINSSDTTCKRYHALVGDWRLAHVSLMLICAGNEWYNACKSTTLYANGSRPGATSRMYLHGRRSD